MSQYDTAWLIRQYLYWGSVDIFFQKEEVVPYSYAEVHRKLRENEVVRSAGRHTSLWESLEFFTRLNVLPASSLEKVYSTLPPSYKTSLSSLHRISKLVKDGVLRRRAMALIVKNSVGGILTGSEGRGENDGKLTIPVTYSRVFEPWQDSLLRVVQQEVLPKSTANGLFKDKGMQNVFFKNSHMVFTVAVLDVELSLYELKMPEGFQPEEGRLKNMHFLPLESFNETKNSLFRHGIAELVHYYSNRNVLARKVVSKINASFREKEPSWLLA